MGAPPPVVRLIEARETIPIRHALLRAGLARESAIFPGDDAAETLHFGAFDREKLVGITSIFHAMFPAQPERFGTWQLRGMATVPEVRGRDFGRALVAAAMSAAAQKGGTILWCHAREPAVEFYAGIGFAVFGAQYEIPTAGPHFTMAIELPAEPHESSFSG